jgi:Elongation factor P, C-terminal
MEELKPERLAFPEVIEARVAETRPPAHAQQKTAWKKAKLKNGVSLQMPPFARPDEILRAEVKSGHCLHQVRAEHNRGT